MLCGLICVLLSPEFGGKPAAAQTHPFPERIDAPEFPTTLDWLNAQPLSKADLKGKFVLLDFWTYCCINCMHILPELHKLEQQFPKNLVVIGVHSAKFETERDTDNIREAILRYEIAHPVINDFKLELWNAYRVAGWPTIVLIDPTGKVVWRRSQEFKAADVAKVISGAMGYYRAQRVLDERPLQLAPERSKEQETPLRFPGKILADESGNRLFISDSNHNRLVIATLDGKLLDVIGSGSVGKKDGDYKTATFNHPQGCALVGEVLYVADTENHLLRMVDLAKKSVVTVAGTGEQGIPMNAFPGWNGQPLKAPRNRWVGRPLATKLNSPWALAIHERSLLIAMAGYHQIWKMPLDAKEVGPLAGNGREDIVDGSRIATTPFEGGPSFAQPSGLTVEGNTLFVADSEGSSVRAVALKGNGGVRTVVGSSHLPKDRLFSFGDRDGSRAAARLQHCLEVVWSNDTLYVADTYNHKIKAVHPETGEVRTVAGTGAAGNSDEPGQFYEPAGLALARGKLYVADTNNHLIRTVDVATGKVDTLPIAGLTAPGQQEVIASAPPATGQPQSQISKLLRISHKPNYEGAEQKKIPVANVTPVEGIVELDVALQLPSGWKINPLAPMSYWLDSPRETGVVSRADFGRNALTKPVAEFQIPLHVAQAGKDEVQVSVSYYYCQTKDEGVCKAGAVVFLVPLDVVRDGAKSPIKLVHSVTE
jgi:thiol-disulfide isomerase/thioredoxin